VISDGNGKKDAEVGQKQLDGFAMRFVVALVAVAYTYLHMPTALHMVANLLAIPKPIKQMHRKIEFIGNSLKIF